MDRQVEALTQHCHPCQLVGSRPKREPIKSTPMPDKPWSELSIDLLDVPGEHYLLLLLLVVMTYGCETWSLSNTQLEKLVTTQRKMERIMIGVTLKDRKSTEWIRKQSGVTDIIRSIRESKTQMGRPRGEENVTIDGQSESQNGYPVEIKDFEADQEQDGAMI